MINHQLMILDFRRKILWAVVFPSVSAKSFRQVGSFVASAFLSAFRNIGNLFTCSIPKNRVPDEPKLQTAETSQEWTPVPDFNRLEISAEQSEILQTEIIFDQMRPEETQKSINEKDKVCEKLIKKGIETNSPLNFIDTQLSTIKIINCNTLPNLSLKGSTIQQGHFFNADMTGACFEGVQIKRSLEFDTVNLESANFTRACMKGTTVKNCILKGANFSKCSFPPAIITANLEGFKGSDLITLDTKQNKTGLVLLIPESWDEESLDQYLNHLNNSSGQSLLTTIDSIDCDKTKVKLACDLIDELGSADVSTVLVPLLSILEKSPYIENTRIQNWIFGNFIKKYDQEEMPKVAENFLKDIQAYFSDPKHNDCKFQYSEAFIQFIDQAIENEGDCKKKALAMYLEYLEDPRVEPLVDKSDMQVILI